MRRLALPLALVLAAATARAQPPAPAPAVPQLHALFDEAWQEMLRESPLLATAMVALYGNIYAGLWFPIVVAAMTAVIGALFLRETRNVDITSDAERV